MCSDAMGKFLVGGFTRDKEKLGQALAELFPSLQKRDYSSGATVPSPPPAETPSENSPINEGVKRRGVAMAQRKGTNALKVNLELGGLPNSGGGLSGLNIPQ